MGCLASKIGTLRHNTTRRAPLETLPRELIWSIVEYAPEKVFDLRLTSAMLKLLVDQFAKMQKSEIAIVDRLRIEFKMNKIWLMFWISKSRANLYKLRRRLRPIHCKIFEVQSFVNDVNVDYYTFTSNCDAENGRVFEYFIECIGNRIRFLILDECSGATWDVVSKLRTKVRISILQVSTIYTVPATGSQILLNAIRECKINSLVLYVRKVEIDAARFLSELSELVSCLHIDTRRSYIRSISSSRDLLGHKGVNWAPIFLDMLSKKLCELFISNYYFPRYMGVRGANMLRKQLPLIGKEIWLTISCDIFTNEYYDVTFNDYKIITSSNWLMIKHNSFNDCSLYAKFKA